MSNSSTTEPRHDFRAALLRGGSRIDTIGIQHVPGGSLRVDLFIGFGGGCNFLLRMASRGMRAAFSRERIQESEEVD